MPGDLILNFGTEKYAYVNPHTEYEGVVFIEKAGITCSGECCLTHSSNYNPNFYKQIYVFEYVISGEEIVECGNEMYRIKAGDFCLLSAQPRQNCYCSAESPCTKIWVSVGGSVMAELMQLYNLQDGVIIRPIDCRRIFDLIYEKCADIEESNKQSAYQNIFGLLVQLLNRLADDFDCDSPSPAPYKIRRFIDANIQSNITLADISSEFFFSKSYIIGCFKTEFGISPKQYIIQKKIETAKKILSETDMSIKAISEMLHFSDSHHFSNTFKKQTGYAPIEYRARTK